MIPAPRHIFLMLCNPLHSVTCFELPVYCPSEAERRDPKLYAHNVRTLMVSLARWLPRLTRPYSKLSPLREVCQGTPAVALLPPAQMEFAGLQDAEATYEDKMRYMAQLKREYGLA